MQQLEISIKKKILKNAAIRMENVGRQIKVDYFLESVSSCDTKRDRFYYFAKYGYACGI